jgi:hypothetical protein
VQNGLAIIRRIETYNFLLKFVRKYRKYRRCQRLQCIISTIESKRNKVPDLRKIAWLVSLERRKA